MPQPEPADDDLPDLTEAEREALHSIELGVEWIHRAHGNLVEFHHDIGHAMNHLDEAESQLRDCGHQELASMLRKDYLPRGAVDDRWTFDLLESFESGFLAELTDFDRLAREDIADGERHVTERQQKRKWQRRARDE